MRRVLAPALAALGLVVLCGATGAVVPRVDGALCGGVRVPLDRLAPGSTATDDVH